MTGPGQPAIIYLDVDDEITSAAARIRSIESPRVALVLPAGSRLATSRINFRLLAREAVGHERELAIVAPEAGTRSLAAAAGLPVFSTVTELEAAAARGPIGLTAPTTGSVTQLTAGRDGAHGTSIRTRSSPRDPRGVDPRAGGPRARTGHAVTEEFDGGTIVTLPRPIEELDGWPAEEGADDEREGRGRGRRWFAVLIAVLLVFAVASGVGAYVLLPTAIVTVRAVPEPVGPITLQITADPLAANVDPVKLVVPAEIVTFELEASDEFPATGVEVIDTAAGGTLRWSNCDPTSAYTIRQGTRARTSSGVAFETTESLFLPVAGLSGGNPPTLTCQSRDVAARAVETGPAGNVPAGAITRVPSNLNAVVIRVSNPEPMTGGEHTEKKLVTVEDVGAAQRALAAALDEQFEELLGDPRQVPQGTQLIPETRASSEPDPDEDPVALIGEEMDSFELTYRAIGTATAVRLADVSALADSLIRAEVAPDKALVKGSVQVDVGAGTPKGAAVIYPVSAKAQQVGTIDGEAVREAIRGRSVGEAQERLRDYGDAHLDVWPGWVTAIPTLDFRLEIRVVADVPTEDSAPTPSPPASATPQPTRRPTPSPTPMRAPSAAPTAS